MASSGIFAVEPGYLLSGDFVFSGDLGRPGLLDEAVGMENTRFEGAKQLFASLKTVSLILPDHVQAFLGHGAGSACGKTSGALPSTTVGYERHFACWAEHEQLRGLDSGDLALIDTRPVAEVHAGTVPGAQQLSAGTIRFRQSELPEPDAGPLVTFCQSGLRNTVAASALRRAGFDVIELDGSYAGWARWDAEQPRAEDAATAAP